MNVPVSIPTKPKLAICEICNKGYSDKSSLKKHLVYHSDEKPFTCEVCSKRFRIKHALTQHSRTHASVKPFVCEICSKGFTLRTTLKRHIYIHTKEKPFICEVCNRGFSQQASLILHRRTHSTEKPFICEICEKGFCQKSNFVAHQRTHTNERPFICDVCNKGFFTKMCLKNHRIFHSKEKLVVCEICNRHFYRRTELLRHLRSHSKKKTFVCEVCGKGYKAQLELNSHRLSHSGVKPEMKICKMPSTMPSTSGISKSNAKSTVIPVVTVIPVTHKDASIPQILIPVSSIPAGDGDTEISGAQRTLEQNMQRKRKYSSSEQVRKLLVRQDILTEDAVDKKIIETQSSMHDELKKIRSNMEKMVDIQEQFVRLQKDTNEKLDLLTQIVALGHGIKIIQKEE